MKSIIAQLKAAGWQEGEPLNTAPFELDERLVVRHPDGSVDVLDESGRLVVRWEAQPGQS